MQVSFFYIFQWLDPTLTSDLSMTTRTTTKLQVSLRTFYLMHQPPHLLSPGDTLRQSHSPSEVPTISSTSY